MELWQIGVLVAGCGLGALLFAIALDTVMTRKNWK